MREAYILLSGYIATYIPWTLIFLLLRYVNIQLYILNDRDICTRIQKRISSYSSHIADNNKGYGYSIGKWYFVSVSKDEDNFSVWLIATSKSYNTLTKDTEEIVTTSIFNTTTVKENLTIYERAGHLTGPWFRKRTIKITSVEPRPNQDVIIKRITEHQEKHGHTVVYLHGPSGSGKTMIGILLASFYKSSYCNTLKPWRPGDTISSICSEIEPKPTEPLILAFDEFDVPLVNIHAGIEPHKHMPIQVSDKTGWNQMLDEFAIGMYPNVILVLTSNKNPEFIRTIDPSYIREGRVDLTFNVE
jgi:hypothetical protein